MSLNNTPDDIGDPTLQNSVGRSHLGRCTLGVLVDVSMRMYMRYITLHYATLV